MKKRYRRVSKLKSDIEWECPKCKLVCDPRDAWVHICAKEDPRALEEHHLFTHAGCMDGSGAAILFRHAGGKPTNIHWCAPGAGVNQALEESGLLNQRFTPLLFVDVCPEGDEIIDRLERRGNFQVIDHHGTAEVHAGKNGFLISVGNKACGTELFRQWLAANVMKKFDIGSYKRMAEVIDDHDRWILSLEFSKELPRFFAFTGQQEFVERFMNVNRFAVKRESYWTDSEKELMRLIQNSQDRRHNNLLKKFRKRQVFWAEEDREITVGYLISGEVNNSELLHRYLAENPDVDLACQINFDHNKVSFRSNDRVDITRFAKQFGGGGHVNSGGQPMPDGMTDMVIERMGHNDGC